MTNQERLSAAYDANLPIETLWNQISETVAYAEAGNSPFSDRQVLVAAVASIAAWEFFSR